MINWYLGISTVAFTCLFAIWSTSNTQNQLIKISLFFLAAFGFLLNLEALGYLIKV